MPFEVGLRRTGNPDVASRCISDIEFAPVPGAWRTFETTLRMEIAKPGTHQMQAWLPIPGHEDASWTKPLDNAWTGNTASAGLTRFPLRRAVPARDLEGQREHALHRIEESRGDARPLNDTAKPNGAAALSEAKMKIYTAATVLTPTDGIVKETALKIVADAKSDLDKARAIYEWIVDNTFRDPKTRGCGAGRDVAGMLKSAISPGNALISTRFTSASRVRQDCQLAIFTADASRLRNSATKAWGRRPRS